jgi:hypothetical protein
MNRFRAAFLFGVTMAASVALAGAADAAPSPRAKRVFDFWTAERVAQAKPRDLVRDERGLAYLRGVDGTLVPYGHSIKAQKAPIIPRPGKPGGSTVVKNAAWTAGGAVQNAAGRILFQMGADYFVCSGTAATDSTTGRSIIITAAHCTYDDVAKAFATNVLFIPNQDATTGTGTDFNCNNDPVGCWAPNFGVVDVNWTTRTFPDNIPWDYAYYVVSDTGAHTGNGANGALDAIAGSLPIDFLPPYFSVSGSLDYTRALGYSYSDDPNFMYCAEDMGTNGSANWWLKSCGLSGGSSGGPWVQPMNLTTGSGPIISVNSWGYTGRAGMAGPKLSGNSSAACLFNAAKTSSLGGGGVVVNPGGC